MSDTTKKGAYADEMKNIGLLTGDLRKGVQLIVMNPTRDLTKGLAIHINDDL